MNQTTSYSQTLDRGLRVLAALAAADGPVSVADLTRKVDMHRSIVYRMVRTLENHRLVARRSDGRYELGLGMATLARSVRPALQSAALPELSNLADDVGMTAFIVVPDGDEAVTLVSVEPTSSDIHITYRPGNRHPIHRGAPGVALLAGRPPMPNEPENVTKARARGWAFSQGEVISGMRSVAAPVIDRRGDVRAAVAVIFVAEDMDQAALGARVIAAATAIAARLP